MRRPLRRFTAAGSYTKAMKANSLHTLRKSHKFSIALLGVLVLSVESALARPLPAPPSVSADSYIVQDFRSGEILAESKAHQRMEPASITKLMTAYLVFAELRAGRLSLTDKTMISEKAWRMPGSRTFVEVDSQVTVEALLKGMIVQSGNDVTVALAEQVAGSEEAFVSLMNHKAKELDLTGTHYVNSTGLPHPDHYSTGKDIATLTRALIHDFPEYYRYYAQKKYTYNGISQYNRNKLLWRDESADGVKTGHTDSAGYCLVASAERDGMRLISVVLGDRGEEARANSSQALLNYGFRFFETRKLYKAQEPIKQVRIWKGAMDTMALGLARPLYVTFPRGDYDKLRASASFNPEILAPVQAGAPYGTLNVSLDTRVIAERPLIALQAVEQGTWWQRLADGVRLWFR